MDNYLTVKQFADAANVSTQRIYQLLAKDLQSYCKTENGKKYINIEALQRFDIEDLQSAYQGLTKSLPSNLQEVAKDLQEENSKLKSKLAALEAETSAQREQIASKDKIIDSLEADKRFLQQQIKEQSEQISNLTAALQAAQALHGIDKKQAVIDMTAAQDQTEPKELAEDPSSQKLSLLQRLFGKRSK